MIGNKIDWEKYKTNMSERFNHKIYETMLKRLQMKDVLTTEPKTVRSILDEMHIDYTPVNAHNLLCLLDDISDKTHMLLGTYDRTNRTVYYRVRTPSEQWFARPKNVKHNTKRKLAAANEIRERDENQLSAIKECCDDMHITIDELITCIRDNKVAIEKLITPSAVIDMMQHGVDRKTAMRIYHDIIDE